MSIEQALEKHQLSLINLPGIVSVGIGLSNDKRVIQIGVDGKHPATTKALPAELEGYTVVVQQVGTIKAR